MDIREDLVAKYFFLGLQQQEIISIIEITHGIKIHPRTLKRILSKMNLFRRKQFSNMEEVVGFIEKDLETSGQLNGYRRMHLKCIQHGLVVTHKLVLDILKLLDPVGVEIRKRRRLRRRQYINSGPNSLWHVDSYDKLKPFGICINGAIDGFSRYIIWLRAGRTSSDPKVIAGYYLGAIKLLKGFPNSVRSDVGTENGVIERIQTALRQTFQNINHHKAPFLKGRSTSNQRIEAWWSILRRSSSQYWINLFENLKEHGLFNGTTLDKALIQFCFLDVIQRELDEVTLAWNVHRLQRSRNSRAESGRPILMFETPALYDANSYLTSIPNNIIDILEQECTFYVKPCDEEIAELCEKIAKENNYKVHSDDPYDAINLYAFIRSQIYDEIIPML